jgi:hypothetical protein
MLIIDPHSDNPGKPESFFTHFFGGERGILGIELRALNLLGKHATT